MAKSSLTRRDIRQKDPFDHTSSGRKPVAATATWIKGYLPVRLRLPPLITLQNLVATARSSSVTNRNSGGDHATSTKNNTSDNDLIRRFNETIFYIKEHQESNHNTTMKSNNRNKNDKNATIFVVNVPLVPHVRSDLLLKSIFGRYGDIQRVTILSDDFKKASQSKKHTNLNSTEENSTRHDSTIDDDDRLLQSWTDRFHAMPSFTAYHNNRTLKLEEGIACNDFFGQFAHVVFKSRKDMKRTLNAMIDIMKDNDNNTVLIKSRTNNKNKNGNEEEDEHDDEDENGNAYLPPAIIIDPIEIQTLMDVTEHGQTEHEQTRNTPDISHFDVMDDEDNFHVDSMNKRKEQDSILAVAERYRRRIPNRIELLNECNVVMDLYEQKELQDQQTQQQQRKKPDEDGFTLVTYSTANKKFSGTKRQYELQEFDNDNSDGDENDNNGMNDMNPNANIHRRGNRQQRARKKKKSIGSSELNDFYSFQMKDTRQKMIQSLRTQFEHDIQTMKEKQQRRNEK
jgi:Ribosomal RNA-processing protein 7 (RRP7) C-terminal domain